MIDAVLPDIKSAWYHAYFSILDDKPGVIGSVGSLCGKHGINICTMGVGQKPDEQKAVLAVSLDKEPDTEAIAEICKLDFVNEIYVCKLD